MNERAYTVRELDALRQACEMRWLYGTCNHQHARMSRTYNENEKAVCVEQLVRTHMLAGHTAEDLYASDRPASSAEGLQK